MINTILQWSVLLHLSIKVRVVNLQIPMPMFAMPQPMPHIFAIHPPPPIAFPIPVPIPVPVPQPTTTTTTTTTTPAPEQNMGIAIPIPMPMPIQIAIPAMPPPIFCQSKPRPKNCPPCPPCVCAPSCTPAFFSFCSPCHQKCRCRKREDVPEPMPPRPPQPMLAPAFPMPVPMAPMVAPAPMVIMPYPPRNRRGKRTWKTASSNEDSCSSGSAEWRTGRRSNSRHNKRFNRYRVHNWRRNQQDHEREDELVKPVLTYISNDGEVKLKQRISADEAAKLLDDRDYGRRPYETVKVIAGQNAARQSQVMVVSDDGEEPQITHRQKQVVLKSGVSQHIIGEGKKELVFRPPEDKTISNLSVSFQVI